MGPLTEALSERGLDQAVLVPQGWLGLLPLHAAWTERSGARVYAMDKVCFTYAPNALSLHAARAIADRTPADHLLAIDNPDGSLVYSPWEVDAALARFTCHSHVLRGAQATAQEVRQQLVEHDILHLSCHGAAGFAEPLAAGLKMAGGTLTLRDILELRLEGVRLAVLSACETSIPGTELPDEVVSLPAGLVQAGVAGVVGSLWSVSDVSTMLLMARFYECWRDECHPPPEALRQAQRWVRDSTNGEKQACVEAFLRDRSGDGASARAIDHYRRYYHLRWTRRPDERDFGHPFHWAAFTYSGA
jgi:CHAT domain-containing protein